MIRVRFAAPLLMSFLSGHASAASQKAFSPEYIAGCFDVLYRFVEDGMNDYGPTQVVERIERTTNDQGDAVFTHFQIGEGRAMKHFLETWQQTEAGSWMQTVSIPSGKTQYQCASAAIFSQWTCKVSVAPKPRRDAARTDYDYLERESSVQLTPSGWVQSERNVKRKSDGSAVANEVGWVEYRRVADMRCNL